VALFLLFCLTIYTAACLPACSHLPVSAFSTTPASLPPVYNFTTSTAAVLYYHTLPPACHLYARANTLFFCMDDTTATGPTGRTSSSRICLRGTQATRLPPG